MGVFCPGKGNVFQIRFVLVAKRRRELYSTTKFAQNKTRSVPIATVLPTIFTIVDDVMRGARYDD